MGTESSRNHTAQKMNGFGRKRERVVSTDRRQTQHEDGNDGVKCVKHLYTWEETEGIRIEKGHYRAME